MEVQSGDRHRYHWTQEKTPCPACSVPKNVNVFLLVFKRVVNVAHVHVHCVHHLVPGQHGRENMHVYGIPSKGPKTAMRRLVAHAGGAKHASLDGSHTGGRAARLLRRIGSRLQSAGTRNLRRSSPSFLRLSQDSLVRERDIVVYPELFHISEDSRNFLRFSGLSVMSSYAGLQHPAPHPSVLQLLCCC
jgi:hypothetical protein